MIDLHSHILPGVDDGAADSEASLAMARAAVADGIRTVVATPHINYDYDYDYAEIGQLVGELNIVLAHAEIPLAVLPGAEISLARLPDLGERELSRLCLGGGPSLLVESPYTRAAGFLDEALFDLEVRGYRPVLAHPERCPLFQADVDRLRALVDRGILCSVNAGSMAGRFGQTVRRFALTLFRKELVHDVSSDSHDDTGRPPKLSVGFESLEAELPGISDQAAWFTEDVPAAILAGDPLPPRPELPARPRSRWRRFVSRL